MSDSNAAYGLWSLVLLNSMVFILFAFSFFRPQSRRDWRSLGMFSAFVVALFTEMYGFPLTLYLLTPWLARNYPELDLLSHEAGHLFEVVLGWRANPHWGPFHLISLIMVFGGFWLLSASWRVLFHARSSGMLAVTGPYAHIRHPQYAAFIIIMFGFLLQWPTLITLIMFPILTATYFRLAKKEEEQMLQEFGASYRQYCERTPAFIPTGKARNPFRPESGAEK